MLRRDWWRVVPRSEFPRDGEYHEIVAAVDLAFKAKELNDPTAYAIVGRRGADLYVLDCQSMRIPFTEQLELVRSLRSRAGTILVEDAANAAALMDTLRGEIPGLVAVKARTSKEARAQAWSPSLEAGQVYLPQGAPWVDGMIEECAAFPRGAHDDRVDALGHAIARLLSGAAQLWIA